MYPLKILRKPISQSVNWFLSLAVRLFISSSLRHPQLRVGVLPLWVRLNDLTREKFPQSHWHLQAILVRDNLTIPVTRSLPYLLPVRSLSLGPGYFLHPHAEVPDGPFLIKLAV